MSTTPAIENCDYTYDSDAKIACYISDGTGAYAYGEEVCVDDIGGVADNLGSDGSLIFEKLSSTYTTSQCCFVPEAYCPPEQITETSICSMADTVSINGTTGLIQKGSFRLKWNNLDDTSDWDTGTKNQYSKLENNELSGTIALVKDIITVGGSESYNFYSTLNTGESQRDPTLSLGIHPDGGSGMTVEILAGGGWTDITYGSVEEEAIKEKYKRYTGGDYSAGLGEAINDLVQQVIDSSIKIQAKYNFKKVNTNRAFRKKNVTIFPDEMGAEIEDTQTATSTMTTTTTTTAGGY